MYRSMLTTTAALTIAMSGADAASVYTARQANAIQLMAFAIQAPEFCPGYKLNFEKAGFALIGEGISLEGLNEVVKGPDLREARLFANQFFKTQTSACDRVLSLIGPKGSFGYPMLEPAP